MTSTTQRPGSSAHAPEGIRPLVEELRRSLRGDVDDSSLSRALYTSDASNYRVVPTAVVHPRSREDVIAAVAAARRHGVPVTMRGGGTSMAGNSVGPGLVIDTSRYLNRIVSLDPEARTAVVEPGVVLKDLQDACAPHGLRFGPDPASGTRCTLGGMIGNNACGAHAMSYGRTADNVLSLTWLTPAGEVITAGSGAGALDAVPGLAALVDRWRALLRTEFGRFRRQVSGYSLEHLLPENGSNLAAALVGTEGTCGVLLEATLRLVPRAEAPALAVLGYPGLAAAADDVPNLLRFRPLALEALDTGLLDAVRRTKGPGSVPDLPEGGCLLIAEVPGDTPDEAAEAARSLADAAATDAAQVLPAGEEASRLWRIREDASGHAGRTQDDRQAWGGWEDSAVPPEYLGDYLRALAGLMDSEGVGGMAYGHFGDGCVHLRLDFPLERDGAVLRRFLGRAAELVAAHGGSLSGEHGDGRARSELLGAMYSPDALAAMAEFKALFDPDDLMNPGIVVRPAKVDADLRRPQAVELRVGSGFAFADDGGSVTSAVHRCVGVGKCRADARGAGAFMCPSFIATREEKDSTRGRARALQEMLNGSLVRDGWRSPEVHEALDLCLSCKACASDCPTGIDMARYKSETLFQTYRRRLRPRSHYALGRLPQWLRLAAPFAPLANVAARVPALRAAALTLMGADRRRSLPRLPAAPFRRQVRGRRRAPADGAEAAAARPGAPKVLLWVDTFSDGLDPQIPRDAIAVLEAAGCDVEVSAGKACCGLTYISTGQLDAAKVRLHRTLDELAPHVQAGRTVVGLEPSCTATLRSDLVELLPRDPRAAEVAASVKTVAELLTGIGWEPPRSAAKLLVQPHCHHYSIMGYGADRKLLDAMGCDVEVSAGCCGLAGNFGMEAGHYEVSEKIARGGILARAESSPDRAILADGFSCRTQVADLAGLEGRHLVQVLAEALRAGGGQAQP